MARDVVALALFSGWSSRLRHAHSIPVCDLFGKANIPRHAERLACFCPGGVGVSAPIRCAHRGSETSLRQVEAWHPFIHKRATRPAGTQRSLLLAFRPEGAERLWPGAKPPDCGSSTPPSPGGATVAPAGYTPFAPSGLPSNGPCTGDSARQTADGPAPPVPMPLQHTGSRVAVIATGTRLCRRAP